MPLDFRVLVQLGCVCGVDRGQRQAAGGADDNTFHLSQLSFKTLAHQPYLEAGVETLKHIYLYHHKSGNKVGDVRRCLSLLPTRQLIRERLKRVNEWSFSLFLLQ